MGYRAYELSRRTKHYTCPYCGVRNKFKPYVYSDTGEIIDIEKYGRCERVNSCGKDVKPFDNYTPSLDDVFTPKRQQQKVVYYLQQRYVEHTTTPSARTNNPLYRYLVSVFGSEIVTRAWERYKVGTDNKNNSFSIWWQIDEQGNIRDGHCMAYQQNGHRVKDGYCNDFIGAKLERANIITNEQHTNIDRCFFGLHLLGEPNSQDKPVYLFESEKTALVASIVLSNVLCMATSGCGGLFNSTKLQSLSGRKVVFFTDDDKAGEKWTNEKARQYVKLCNLTSLVRSNWLDGIKYEYDANNGWDFCDHIIKLMQDQHARAEQAEQKKAETIPEQQPKTIPVQPITTDENLPFTMLCEDVPF